MNPARPRFLSIYPLTLVIVLVLLLSLLVFPTLPAYAATKVINDQASCQSIGGSWIPGTCYTSDNLNVAAGDTLIFASTALISGIVTNAGTLEFNENANLYSFTNTGTIRIRDTIFQTGPVTNNGNIVIGSSGSLDISDNATNNGIFTLLGSLYVRGSFTNNGTFNVCNGYISGTIQGNPPVNYCPVVITITTPSLPNGSVGENYSQQLSASGSTSTIIFRLRAGSLPNGLTLSSAGVLSGVPTQAGNFTFTINARDDMGYQASREYLVRINKGNSAVTVSSSPNPSEVGQSVTLAAIVTVSGGTPTGTVRFAANGNGVCVATLLNGQASCPTVFTSEGNKILTAIYIGDTNYNGSTSAPSTHTVITPTATPTRTATSTNTATPTASNTPTNTPTNTPVPPTSTSTSTPTHTPVPPTSTATNTPTNTPVPPTTTPTNTPLPTATALPVQSTVIASADSYVQKNDPKKNFGSTTKLVVDGTDDPREAYVRFSINAAGSIRKAVLRLYVTEGTKDGPRLYQAANTTWTESGLIWNNRPGATGPVLGNVGKVNEKVWIEYDVTALVTGNGTYSFVLVGDSTDSVEFASRETNTKPQLVLTVQP